MNPGFHVIVEKSTVPVRTSEILEKILISNAGSSVQTAVLNNPEFLAEGTAIRDLSLPDRVLIGWLLIRKELLFFLSISLFLLLSSVCLLVFLCILLG